MNSDIVFWRDIAHCLGRDEDELTTDRLAGGA